MTAVQLKRLTDNYIFKINFNKKLNVIVFSGWKDYKGIIAFKLHVPLLVRIPVNSFEFQPFGYSTQAADFTR